MWPPPSLLVLGYSLNLHRFFAHVRWSEVALSISEVFGQYCSKCNHIINVPSSDQCSDNYIFPDGSFYGNGTAFLDGSVGLTLIINIEKYHEGHNYCSPKHLREDIVKNMSFCIYTIKLQIGNLTWPENELLFPIPGTQVRSIFLVISKEEQ